MNEHTTVSYQSCPACKQRRRALRCDCGAAEQGHSPDCAYVRGTDNIAQDHDEAREEDG